VRSFRTFGIGAVLSIGLATSLSAAPIAVFSTGVCSGLNTNLANCQGGAGSQLNYGVGDANYVFSGFSTIDLTEHAISTYVADSLTSEWLTPGSVAGAIFPTGAYTVTTTFSLAGFLASSLILSLDIAADNDVIAALNGTTILSCNSGGSICFTAFTSNHSLSAGGFALAGLNTLTFTVTNENNPSPTALRVQVSGTATSTTAVPEPGTLVLVGVGVAGLGFRRRRVA
jgi:hypothetical protein